MICENGESVALTNGKNIVLIYFADEIQLTKTRISPRSSTAEYSKNFFNINEFLMRDKSNP